MVDFPLTPNLISSVMLICYENDRPLQGMIANLDWRFNGHFSSLIKKQVLTGAKGETIYAPLRWNDQTLHFVVIGGGFAHSESERKSISTSLYDIGLKKMDELKLKKIAVSLEDWNLSKDHPSVKERSLWILN